MADPLAHVAPLPPFAPLLLAFDLDGTLLADGGHEVPPASLPMLAKLRSLGVKLAIVTGRDTVPQAVQEAVQPDAVATNNGGRLEVGGQLHRETHFSEADLRAVLAHELGDADISLFAGGALYVDQPGGNKPENWMVARGFRPLSEAPGEGIFKVGFYHPDVAAHAARLRQSHPHLVITGGQEPYPHFLTVTPAGADKAAALTLLAGALDVPLERTVAFGDSDNDEVMLELAGFAVQVGDLPLLRPHADARLVNPFELGAYLGRLTEGLKV